MLDVEVIQYAIFFFNGKMFLQPHFLTGHKDKEIMTDKAERNVLCVSFKKATFLKDSDSSIIPENAKRGKKMQDEKEMEKRAEVV